MKEPLKVIITRDKDNKPLIQLCNMPGHDSELTFQDIDMLADALNAVRYDFKTKGDTYTQPTPLEYPMVPSPEPQKWTQEQIDLFERNLQERKRIIRAAREFGVSEEVFMARAIVHFQETGLSPFETPDYQHQVGECSTCKRSFRNPPWCKDQ
jgi:hypothetical protein